MLEILLLHKSNTTKLFNDLSPSNTEILLCAKFNVTSVSFKGSKF